MNHLLRGGRRLSAAVLAGLVVVAGAACGGGSPHQRHTADGRPEEVVVASFNFPESELLAQIYVQALAAAGVPVRAEMQLGTREMVLPAFQQGYVDLLPEYLGSALDALDASATIDMSDRSAVAARLDEQLTRWHGRILAPSPAQDQNGLAVTRTTAARYGLRSISDLVSLDGRLTLTGPSECPQRPYCLIGLRNVYGLHVRDFLPLDSEQQRVTALDQGVADVAVIFSTSGALAGGDLVLLTDDRHLQPADNVIPVVSDRAVTRFGSRLTDTLNRVSAGLTDSELVFLNWRIGTGGRSPAAEAHGWLVRRGLAPP
ncbi:MAG TPA: ABC transporter substrate-binding protein [Acidimicrobiales bacterium]|nr:ABC transporter substrate-binding protein [Acidimicrobiales bacterium]